MNKKIILFMVMFSLSFMFASAESGIDFGDGTEVDDSSLSQNFIYVDYDYSLNETENFEIAYFELAYKFEGEFIHIPDYMYRIDNDNHLFWNDQEFRNEDSSLTPLVTKFDGDNYSSSISKDFGLIPENSSMNYKVWIKNLADTTIKGYSIFEMNSLSNFTGNEFSSMNMFNVDFPTGFPILDYLYVIEDDGDLKKFTEGGWNVTDLKTLKMTINVGDPLLSFEAGSESYTEVNGTIAVGYGNNYSVDVYYSRSLLGSFPDNKVLWAFNISSLWSGEYRYRMDLGFCPDSEGVCDFGSYNVTELEAHTYHSEWRDLNLTSDIDMPDISIISSPENNAEITDNYINVEIDYDYSSYLSNGWSLVNYIIYAEDENEDYVNHQVYGSDLSSKYNNITTLYLDDGTYTYYVFLDLYNENLDITRDFRTNYKTINIVPEITYNLDTENQLINLITIILIIGLVFFLYEKVFKGKK